MRSSQKFFTTILLLFLHTSVSAFAADNKGRGYLGALGGLGFPSGTSPVFSVGASGMYKIWSWFGVGPYFQNHGLTVSVVASDLSQVDVVRSTQHYGLDASVFGSGSLAGFHFGTRTGYGHSSTEATAVSLVGNISITDSDGFFFAGPKFGYDYGFGRFSGGAEASYLLGFGTSATSVFLFNLAAKFWF